MVASVAPPMRFSASATAMEAAPAAEPLAPMEAEADTTSDRIEDVSLAVTLSMPAGAAALTVLAEIPAVIAFVVVLVAFAPAPAPASEKLPLPAMLAETATATASMVFAPIAERL